MSIALRLKVMSFLQYFIWGSWLVTLGSYMINTLHFTGANVGMVYSSKGIAAIIMPGIMGIIADKWLRAERAYMLCHLVCAGVLFYAASVTDPDMMFWVMLVNAMAFMPTIALSNSVSYSCLAQAGLDPVTAFPPIRVFGTVGFIVAMWAVSLLHLELSSLQLYIASGASLLLSVNRPGFPGECFICELRLPDHRFRWKHNKLFLLLPEEYGPAFPAIVDCYTSPPT
ncbi:xanthosine permease [Escherichia coli HVH 178 (4-3189163)]|nr:xanthosine permease [Escherichia coli HVH 178 (4-3189163)]